MDVSSKLSAFPLPSVPLSRDTLRAAFMKLLLSGRSRPPDPSSVIAFLPGVALRLDWGPHVIGPLAVGTGAFQLRLSRMLKLI